MSLSPNRKKWMEFSSKHGNPGVWIALLGGIAKVAEVSEAESGYKVHDWKGNYLGTKRTRIAAFDLIETLWEQTA